ncbi:uncharacterized protein J8A68_005474 [[Candida] subhashii]|uniref:N-glycosylation protein EOS1 n=1 Tax=[Candida] subhashii TaxID=561895 RepID=A0A8J5QF64_9ASCO|nr:uncharacterized protein J8A68_005474 [[Candida] subhashii]KAG7660954.1 hypothetical protein J8A68_005474 [[Candida] subhashii]
MPFFESLRKRFKNTPLESNQIDDDYSETIHSRSSTNINRSSSQVHDMISTTSSTSANHFDPHEIVPSYEISQRLHVRNRSRHDIFTNNHISSIPIDDHDDAIPISSSRIYAPIPSLPIPVNMSRSNSSSSLNSDSTEITSPQQPSIQQQASSANKQKKTIKQLGLRFLNSRQHFALAFCRDVSLIPALIGLFQSWRRIFPSENDAQTIITSARGLEHFLTGVWCIVAAYLNYSVLDGLIIRWIVTYSTLAAIVRVLSLSTMCITVELYLVSAFSAEGYKYGLHIWILISCILTFAYIIQNFVTSNIDINNKTGRAKKRRGRVFDFYNIVVFAVVPVGLASFVTMIGLLRSLLILRIDVDQALKLSSH